MGIDRAEIGSFLSSSPEDNADRQATISTRNYTSLVRWSSKEERQLLHDFAKTYNIPLSEFMKRCTHQIRWQADLKKLDMCVDLLVQEVQAGKREITGEPSEFEAMVKLWKDQIPGLSGVVLNCIRHPGRPKEKVEPKRY
jgi:hypothetical protein